jgi:hypothetical protein
VGLARGTFYPPGGNGKEDTPSINGACAVISSILCTLRVSPLVTVLCAQFGEKWWYRHICAIGGVFNILMMMGANLVGFVVGMDGAQYFAYQLVGSWSGECLPPMYRPALHVRAQVFVSSSSRLPVCSLAYSSCSSTGAFVRLCVDFC